LGSRAKTSGENLEEELFINLFAFLVKSGQPTDHWPCS
jgi:hypothetical protein